MNSIWDELPTVLLIFSLVALFIVLVFEMVMRSHDALETKERGLCSGSSFDVYTLTVEGRHYQSFEYETSLFLGERLTQLGLKWTISYAGVIISSSN